MATADVQENSVAARHGEVVGAGPRVHPLSREDASPEQLDLIRNVRVSVGADPEDEIAGFFLTAAKHPALFRCQLEAGKVYFTGAIPVRDRELIILRTCWLCQAPYGWGEHVDIGKRAGIAPEEVERVTHGSAAPGWNDHDRAMLRGVEELLENQAMSDQTWSALSSEWSEQQLLEFPMLVGAYFSLALQQNMLRIPLASDNPGLSHR